MMPEADRLSPQQLLVSARQKDPILAERLAAMPSNDAELAAAIGAGPVVLGLIGTPDPTDKEPRAPPFRVFDAIKRAGTTDGPKVRDAIAATKDFLGVTGKTTIDAYRNAPKAAVVITVKDGKYKHVETIQP